MLLYLIGFMGCGKSTIGRSLAKALNYKFIDLDRSIERTTNKSISELFSNFGESIFREIEFNELKNTLNLSDTVIATGGGCPCFSNAMELINHSGISIYIELNEKSLSQRLMNSKAKRPLIKDYNELELLDYVTLKLQERKQNYLKANITINGLSLKLDDLILEINRYKEIKTSI